MTRELIQIWAVFSKYGIQSFRVCYHARCVDAFVEDENVHASNIRVTELAEAGIDLKIPKKDYP